MQNPENLYAVDRRLQSVMLKRMNSDDFVQSEHTALFNLLTRALEQDEEDALKFIQANTPENLKDLTNSLMQPEKLKVTEAKMRDDLLRTLIKLRTMRVNEGISQLRYLQEEAQQSGGTDLNPYNEMILQYTRERNKLDKAMRDAFELEGT